VKDFLDYVDGNSILHKLNPMTKLILSFGLYASCFLTQKHATVALIALFNLCLGALGHIPCRSVRIFVSLLKLSALLLFAQVFFVSRIPFCVPLLISSVRRIEVSAISAGLLGFNLRNRTSGYKRYGFAPPDAAVLFVCIMIIAASVVI
jgi:energy-coupling factor transporter transmembrane protein EcfT